MREFYATTAATAAGQPFEDHRGFVAAESAATAEGREATPGSTSARKENLTDSRADDFEFNIAVDVIYHRARASWLLWSHRALLFGAIMFGSVAATEFGNAKVCAVLAAACAALDLVFDPITIAAVHHDAGRRLHLILTAARREHFSPSALAEADTDLMELSVDEPAPYNLLRTLAFNEATKALGRDRSSNETVAWYLRPLVNVFRFEGW